MKTPARSGFTLIEGLIACALIGIVLAVAGNAFGEMFKASDITRSKLKAEDDAQRAAKQLSALLGRCHIIFFSGYPILRDPVGAAANRGQNQSGETWARISAALNTTIPPTLRSASSGTTRTLRYNFANPQNRTPWVGGATPSLGSFRFVDPTVAPAARLRSNNLTEFNAGRHVFDAPLLYAAEAIFDWTNTNGLSPRVGLPMAWNIHVLYLAPTPPNDRDPNLASDRDFGTNTANVRWDRSTVPLELHLLTIPNVKSGINTTGTPPAAANLGWSWINDGRKPIPAGETNYQAPPMDYVQNRVNFDPLPLPWGPNGGAGLRLAGASGNRVRGALADAHGNFNNIGNDPPNDAALGDRLLGTPTDHVLVSNIDPDSAEGTTVRLYNTIGQDSGHALAAGESSPRLLKAYLGDFAYSYYAQHYSSAATTPASMFGPTGTAGGGHGALPRRAFVSVALRYRSRAGIPFQFATATAETDLTPLVSYQRKLLEDLQ